jgi:hypothetical protein
MINVPLVLRELERTNLALIWSFPQVFLSASFFAGAASTGPHVEVYMMHSMYFHMRKIIWSDFQNWNLYFEETEETGF